MFPKRLYRLIFSIIMSFVMSFIMSGVTTYFNIGLSEAFLAQWLLHSFPKAWGIAFVIVFFIVPKVAKLSESLIKKD